MSDVNHAALIHDVLDNAYLAPNATIHIVGKEEEAIRDHATALQAERDEARAMLAASEAQMVEEQEERDEFYLKCGRIERALAAEREKVRLLVVAVRELILMGNEATMLLDGEFVSAEHWLRETHGFPDNEGEVTT